MLATQTGTKRVVIEPVTRVEGHGKVTILLDDAGQVTQARLHIVEFRGFERFVQGRPFWEMPVAVQRLCGICPVSHHLCAAKAVDRLVGGEALTPTAEAMRRLMHYGQFFQSHALHFFHLASPDLLFGFGADVSIRNVIGVAGRHPELAKQGILMRKYGQEVIRLTAGKKIHGTGAIPGGINKNLSLEERDFLLADLEQMTAWAQGAVAIARDYTLENFDAIKDFGSFPSNHLSLVRADGALELYDGLLKAVDPDGTTILEGADNQDYLDIVAEEVRSWSYMKFPFLRALGPEHGWYRVGPLARLNTCTFIDTPLAEAARREFAAVTGGKPNHVTMAYHWARMIEALHAIEKIAVLLHDPVLQGEDLVVKGEPRREAVGILEAPRGTLFHHYKIDENDQVVMANLIVSTTSNNEAMNRAVEGVARQYLSGHEITEGLLNHVEVAIRAYDPCLSCATHALGRMPLVVDLIDAEGALLDPEGARRMSEVGRRILVLAWGNPGRLDDGLGPALAARLAAAGLPGVTVEADYQLQVEDAAAVAAHDVVVFADATVSGPAPFTFERLEPSYDVGFTTHAVAPSAVLGLARTHFGAVTEGWVLAIRGEVFDDFGEGLSPAAEANLEAASEFLLAQVGKRDFDEVRTRVGASPPRRAAAGKA